MLKSDKVKSLLALLTGFFYVLHKLADMQDGFYINDVWVCGSDTYSLTRQGFDILKPDERRASFSNSFTLPDTQDVRKLTQNAEQLDAGSEHPYVLLPARLIDTGEVVFSGLAEFTRFQNGWSVNLLSSQVGFFDRIKSKKLSELNLSELDHVWSLDNITARAGAKEGVVYLIIDGGTMNESIIPYDTMTPSVYAMTVIEKIATEAGYKLNGKWLADELIKRIAIPYTGATPKSHDQEWIDERTARVTTRETNLGSKCDTIIPLTIDNDFGNGWTDGKFFDDIADVQPIVKIDNFKPDIHAYVCADDMTVKVQAFQSYNVTVISGVVEAKISIEKNGVPIADTYVNHEGLYNQWGLKQDSVQVEAEVKCKKGDQLKIRFMFGKRTLIGKYYCDLSFTSEKTWASFMPTSSVAFNEMWPIAPNLPDMTCAELMLSVAYLTCSDFDVDEERKTIDLIPLDVVLEEMGNAKDWSNRVDESYEPELITKLDSFGRRNLLKWKEQDKPERKGFGDGVILCPAPNYPESKDLLEMPFAAVVNSPRSLAGYGNPLLIQTRTVTSSSVQRVDAAPCLVLVDYDYTQDVTTEVLDGEEVRKKTVRLTGCWFGRRVGPMQRTDTKYCLCFDQLPGMSEQSLIQRYFKALRRVLRRPRQFTPYLYLKPSDVADFNQRVPIRIRGVSVGSHLITDSIFYVNKIASFRGGIACPVTLIAL